jgi:hypothetical protein
VIDAEAVFRPVPAAATREAASHLVRDAVLATFTIGGSFVCWAIALRGADLTDLSGYGLLTALPAAYFAGLVLLTLGFAYSAAATPVRPALLGAHVLALVVQLHATAAILYDEPRYSWTYKHLGVVDYIQQNGQVHRWIDIYHNWPAFFALTAWVAKAAGVEPIALAPWAQLFFELAAVAAIVFALRGLTRDPRRVWIAAWLFVVANWVGQDYLSPQAFAFVLAIVVIGLALRLAPPEGRRRSMFGRQIQWAVRGGDGTSLVTGGPARAILAAGAVCSLAVIVSHQLSPIFLILDLCTLALLTRRPSWPVIGVLVAAEVGWVALGWTFISTHFSLFDVTSSLEARGVAAGHPLPGVTLGEQLPQLSMGVVGILAIAGFIRAWRAGRRLLVPLALAGTPFPFVAAQSYGGEGPLRAYLFALPFLALVAAELVVPGERTRTGGPPRTRSVVLVAATVLIAGGSLFGYFGQETLNKITSDDIAASRWFLDNTHPGARAVLFASNFPERVDANYVDHLDSAQILVRVPGVAGPHFATRGLVALERMLRNDSGREEYVIVTPSQLSYLRFNGMAPPGAAEELTRSLEQSGDFEVVFRTGASEIFRFTGNGGTS